MPTGQKPLGYLIFFALAFGALLRFLFIDADPNYYDWEGYIIDEGRWVFHAREFFLFHTVSRDSTYDLHLILAPLFQLINYFIFDLMGVSRLSSRIFTACCGSALLLLFLKHLRHTTAPLPLLAGILLLAVQVDFVVLSRLAVPEMVIILFQALAYFALVSSEPSRRRMVMLGVLMLIAVGMKGTVVFFLGIMALMIVFLPRVAGESANRLRGWQNLLWFWCGFAAPVLISGAVWIGCCAPESTFEFAKFPGSNLLTALIGFLRLSDIYRILSFPFKESLAPALNILALGLWLSWLGWVAADREQIDVLTRRYLVTSTTWLVAYLALMVTLDYFPRRYMVHVVLPMAINITVGISLLQKVGIPRVLAALQRNDRFHILRLAVFVLPAAVFLAPLLALAIALAGMDPEPLRIQLSCVVLAVAVTTCIARVVASREGVLKFFVVFPILQASLWVILSAALDDVSLWPTAGAEMSRWLYPGSVAVTSIAALAVIFTDGRAVTGAPLLIVIYALGYVAASITRLAPAYLEPHYTIRDASRNLGVMLDRTTSIAAFEAEGLFNDNILRYRRFDPDAWKSDPSEIIVSGANVFGSRRKILDEQYHAIKAYEIYVSPEYHKTHPTFRLPKVTVYRKNQ